MKTNCKVILVLAVLVGLTLAVLPCRAAENKEENIWSEDEPNLGKEMERPHKEHMPGNEAVARMRPGRGPSREIPQRFGSFRKSNEEVERMRPGREGRPPMHLRTESNISGIVPPPPFGMCEEAGRMSGFMQDPRWHERYMKWLKKNCPVEAEELTKMGDKNPELFSRKFWQGYRRYGKIAEAARENPELAKILKNDLVLKDKLNELLKNIRSAADEKEKKELTKELEKVVGERFDLIVKRKQIEYERLLKRLEELKKQVKESESKVEKWKDAKVKEENVKTHIEELVQDTNKFEWN